MVHDNHEGFAHPQKLYPRRRRPLKPVELLSLPDVDTSGYIKLLPTGWTALTAQATPSEASAESSPASAVPNTATRPTSKKTPSSTSPATHRRSTSFSPTRALIRGDHGSPTLDTLLQPSIARFWFHDHSTPIREPRQIANTTIVPLGDIAFHHGESGAHGWSILELDGSSRVLTTTPPSILRESRKKFWTHTPQGLLVHPGLNRWIE
jgi:hypothetical protein